MLRKLIFVVSAVALTLVACGRQVTPDRTGTSNQGLLPGQMQIKFNTAGAMNFSNVWYVLAFNTSGTGGEPYAINGNPNQNWLDFSFEIIISQAQGQLSPQATLVQFLSQPGVGGGTLKVPRFPLPYTPQQLQLNPNCNGQQTQICVTIDRALFSGLAQATAPPTTSPSASPSGSPTASPSSSPTATPTSQPFSNVWYINWFTVNPSSSPTNPGQVIDAPGPNGPTDVTWVPENPASHNYNITTQIDAPWNAVPPPGWPQVALPAAQISGGEVLNNP